MEINAQNIQMVYDVSMWVNIILKINEYHTTTLEASVKAEIIAYK